MITFKCMVTCQDRRLDKLKIYEKVGIMKWINITKEVEKEKRQSLTLRQRFILNVVLGN